MYYIPRLVIFHNYYFAASSFLVIYFLALNAAQMQNPPQMIKPEQQQNFLQILDNAMKQLSQKHPETDLKNYIMLKNAIMTVCAKLFFQ